MKLEAAGTSRSTLVNQVIFLSWFTIVYNVIEGVVSMYFGIEEISVALFGFGVDSFIEAASAMIVLWRFRGEAGLDVATRSNREEKASAWIGRLFIFLASATFLVSVIQLVQQRHPETTVPGVIISLISLSFMFFLWWRKKTLGHALQSSTVLSDAACSLACIKLSGILLAGSFIFYIQPALWWVDSVAAIGMSYFIFKEGQEMVKTKGSCHGCC